MRVKQLRKAPYLSDQKEPCILWCNIKHWKQESKFQLPILYVDIHPFAFMIAKRKEAESGELIREYTEPDSRKSQIDDPADQCPRH